MSTVLVILLLTSQFPPAPGNVAARLAFENDSGLPGAERPENQNPDLLLADVLHGSAFRLPQSARHGAESGSSSVGDGTPASFSDIRAPPRLS